MEVFKAKFGLAVLVVMSLGIGFAALYELLKPISNGCIMTYMYPTYIPISMPANVSSGKYGLYLYHEGWKQIDFNEHLKKLSGVPVLFIPGNGGSFKQVRSLAAESDRAYQYGPLERSLYQEASLRLDGVNVDVTDGPMPNYYARMLDWFAVDLEGEHSAMDGQILEEHTEYVVYAIHRILDHYKESHDARAKEGASVSATLPNSVILVGHSMGGFVARAAVIHPHLRKLAVETVLTLSAPHQSPPLALQPSLGYYYEQTNQVWRKGYELQYSQKRNHFSGPRLSQVVVISISGGSNDYQVRSKLESLDGIVPSTHGFMISSTSMKNVWLSMEHQVIMWCNQLVMQVSHTLLSLIDSRTGHPFSDTTKRLSVFAKMLHSGMPESWLRQSYILQQPPHVPLLNVKDSPGSQLHTVPPCPSKVRWSGEGLERDLYIKTSSVTVLAMDGRRRWLDIKEQESNGRKHFIFVTNLAPCHGVRLHLWPEKGMHSDSPAIKKVVEVTSKMVQIPSGPALRQMEPGSQTEQPPPSAVLWLDSKDMHGFRFLTISVAPSPAVSGRPPPAASMAVGQFFDPEEGNIKFSYQSLLLSVYSQNDILLKENNPLALNLSFAISLGLLPVKLSVETTGCGLKKSGFPAEDLGDMETSKLCKLRCFPPVALAWDATSGLHIFPSLYSKKIVVDASPGLWSSTQGSDETNILLLVDPHCSYKLSISASLTAAGSRFFLLYFPQIVGLSFAIVYFALMRQANAWELDLPIPSLLTAVESNLRMPLPFLFLFVSPITIALLYSCLSWQPLPPVASFFAVSIICCIIANGFIIILISISQLTFYMSASAHVFIKTRWRWQHNIFFMFFDWLLDLSAGFLSFKVARIMRANPLFVTSLLGIVLVSFIHPALGLFILLLSHAFCCHHALSSHARTNDLFGFRNGLDSSKHKYIENCESLHSDESSVSSPNSARSYGDTQLEIFYHWHGLLILHFLSALMFAPSLAAWLQRIGMGHRIPWFLDSALCIGVILHGICNSKLEYNVFFPVPGIPGFEVRQGFVYLLAGYCCYFCGLAMVPYRVFYAIAVTGLVSFVYRILERRNRERGEAYYSSRKHSHRH